MKLTADARTEEEMKKIEEAKYPLHEFSHTGTLRLTGFNTQQRMPTMLTFLAKQMLGVVYDDGWFDVIQFSDHLVHKVPEKRLSKASQYTTTVLSAFQPYPKLSARKTPGPTTGKKSATATGKADGEVPSSSKDKDTERRMYTIQRVLSANRSNCYGSHGYRAEFFTVSDGYRIVHWGLRPISLLTQSASLTVATVSSNASVIDSSTVGSDSASQVAMPTPMETSTADKGEYVEEIDLYYVHSFAAHDQNSREGFEDDLLVRMAPDVLGVRSTNRNYLLYKCVANQS